MTTVPALPEHNDHTDSRPRLSPATIQCSFIHYNKSVADIFTVQDFAEQYSPFAQLSFQEVCCQTAIFHTFISAAKCYGTKLSFYVITL